ncbi:RHS repeat-associated core domain-containing protein [Paenibacillus pasadenensis]|uniref:RHS repeat-associated core domain-containing protein n=1 Tax=Paenibacillus pasadenensis TaxID=217090 RepID=UPI00203D84B7|nr:RHS repeat-associated core domain-containing protein [Paenibacillus pasadenensis]
MKHKVLLAIVLIISIMATSFIPPSIMASPELKSEEQAKSSQNEEISTASEENAEPDTSETEEMKQLQEIQKNVMDESLKDKKSREENKDKLTERALLIAAFHDVKWYELLNDKQKETVLNWDKSSFEAYQSDLSNTEIAQLEKYAPEAYMYYSYSTNLNSSSNKGRIRSESVTQNTYDEELVYREHVKNVMELMREQIEEKSLQLNEAQANSNKAASKAKRTAQSSNSYIISEKNTEYNYSVDTEQLVDPLYRSANQRSNDLFLSGKPGLDLSIIRKYNSMDSKAMTPQMVTENENLYLQISRNFSAAVEPSTIAEDSNFIATGWSLNIPEVSSTWNGASIQPIPNTATCPNPNWLGGTTAGSCESIWYLFMPTAVNKVSFTLDDGTSYEFSDNGIIIPYNDYGKYNLEKTSSIPYNNVEAYRQRNTSLGGALEFFIILDSKITYVFDENGKIKEKRNEYGDRITYLHTSSGIFIKDSYNRDIVLLRDGTHRNITSINAYNGSSLLKTVTYNVTPRSNTILQLKNAISTINYWTLDSVTTTSDGKSKTLASYTYKNVDMFSAADFNFGPQGYFYYSTREGDVQHPFCVNNNCSQKNNNIILWSQGNGVVQNFFETIDIEKRRQDTYGEIAYVLLDEVNLYNDLKIKFSYDQYVNAWSQMPYTGEAANIGYREQLRGTTRLFLDKYNLQYISYHPVTSVNFLYKENGQSKIVTDSYKAVNNKKNGYSINEMIKSRGDHADDADNKRLKWATRYGRQTIETCSTGAEAGLNQCSFTQFELRNLKANREMYAIANWSNWPDNTNLLNETDSAAQEQYGFESQETTYYAYSSEKPKVASVLKGSPNLGRVYFSQTQYDGYGLPILITDERNNKTTYEYNGPFRNISKKTTLSSDNAYRLVEDYEYYSASDSVVNRRNMLKKMTQTQFYPNPDNPAETHSDLIVTEFSVYNSNRQVVESSSTSSGQQFSQGSSTSAKKFEYDTFGRLITESTSVTLKKNDPPSWLTMRYEYDSLGRLLNVTSPDNSKAEYTYDTLDRMLTEKIIPVGASPRTTTYSYDDANRTVSVTDANGLTTITRFSPFGLEMENKLKKDNVERITQRNESNNGVDVSRSIPFGDAKYATTYRYDSLNRLLSETNSIGEATTYLYSNKKTVLSTNVSSLQNTVRVLDPYGKETTTYSNNIGAVTRTKERDIENNEVRETHFSYSPFGKVIKNDVKGEGTSQTTSFSFDAFGNQLSVLDAAGQRHRFVHNASGQLIKSQSEDKIWSTKEYNELGWLLSQRKTGTQETELYTYSSVGMLDSYTDRKKQVHRYNYNAHYQPLSYEIKDVNGVQTWSEQYTYDPATLQLLSEKSSDNEQIDFTYTTWGDLNSFKSINREYKLNYDNLFRLSSLTYPDNSQVKYEYDELDRIQNVNYPGMGTVTYDHQNNGRNQNYTINYPNGYNQMEKMNSFGDIVNVEHKIKSTNQVIWNEQVKTDDFGNKFEITENNNKQIFNYDLLNRIESESKVNSSDTDRSYQYDTSGNRKEEVSGTLNLDLLKSVDYTYDGKNQLKQSVTDGVIGDYTYYASGLRASKTVDGEYTRYIYYNGKVIEELDRNGAVKARNVWGNELLYRESGNDKGYYYYNSHGDVVSIKDAVGQELNRYQYDIWGNVLSQEEQMSNPFKYTGEITDEESGLIYLRTRYYNPAIGRFINEDTYEGNINNPLSLNLYTYVTNNPLIYIDPLGMCGVKSWEDAGDCFVQFGKIMWNDLKNIDKGLEEVANFLIIDDIRTLQNPNSSLLDRTMAYAGIIPIGKVARVGEKLFVEVLKNGNKVRAEVSSSVKWKFYTKHIPQKNLSWNAIIKSTANGANARYKPGIDIESLERYAWEYGTQANNRDLFKVIKFDKVIGASDGKETVYMRVEMNSMGEIHGHPISEDRFKKYLK